MRNTGTIRKKGKKLAELEEKIENRLIEQLTCEDSQWTYRPELKTEQDLWANFRKILEQNNRDRLDGQKLSDSEFEQVKNIVQFSSFYNAGQWLAGENGRVYANIQRGNKKIPLLVLDQSHIAGGKTVYEVINQYRAPKQGSGKVNERDRRFDVTLLINGLPMIHIELKNRVHPITDGFNQIKKYIKEGKFKGIFSTVQMFVVSNGSDTKYFSAARDTELNPKFMSRWLDKGKEPVSNYIDFAKQVLRIPQAHKMVSQYMVLDYDKKRLILLRPYQIHAIEAMGEASKNGKSGFIWHTTGSGKTITSYKGARNLLLDIPKIDKTVFLIDRNDLNEQTAAAFESYAGNDRIDVDDTESTNELKEKLSNSSRQMIVATRQKLQALLNRMSEKDPAYKKIKSKTVAFVVDECHRAISPESKREIDKFFANPRWYGFTGTPRFDENSYEVSGDLPLTTEKMYGKCLHDYTIKEAVKDEAVLPFSIEYLGDEKLEDGDEEKRNKFYESEEHMLFVLDKVLNNPERLGIKKGSGETYEAILTTTSIDKAQRYYELAKKIVRGETRVKINSEIKKALPDYPKFAITYSVSENENDSLKNQDKMRQALSDYNKMFGTDFQESEKLNAYNTDLNDRLARKKTKYKSRREQLDLVIVVDRLLTGFDAPCMNTLYIDRPPMSLHGIIQAFSRTNRIFDKDKQYGNILIFQHTKKFKEDVDKAIKLFSLGGESAAVAPDWAETERNVKKSLSDLREFAPVPEAAADLSLKQKKAFVKIYQKLNSSIGHLRAFSNFDGKSLEDYSISETELEEYHGHYVNILAELKDSREKDGEADFEQDEIDFDYQPITLCTVRVDYDYIVGLLQGIAEPEVGETPEEFEKKMRDLRKIVEDYSKDNQIIADLLSKILDEIEEDREKYANEDISVILYKMKNEIISAVADAFVKMWRVGSEEVINNFLDSRHGEIPYEQELRRSMDYKAYCEECEQSGEKPLPKFMAKKAMQSDMKRVLKEEIMPLEDIE